MSEYIIMPQDDYKNICDILRNNLGKTNLIKSGELFSETQNLIDKTGKAVFKRSTMPSEYWTSIAYGAGKFVAIGHNGKTAYSMDGINWTELTMPSTGDWYSITYGNDKFVAVGDSICAYSIDGINWISSTIDSYTWPSITYGDGKFVAVSMISHISQSPKIAYSTDGINWAIYLAPFSRITLNSVTYGNGKFVATSNNDTNQYCYSTDGINWIASKLPDKEHFLLTYYAGKFIILPKTSSCSTVIYSTDGINWTEVAVPLTGSFYGVTASNKQIVAVKSHKAMYSTDGINWVVCTMPPGETAFYEDWSDIAYGDNKFVVVSHQLGSSAYCNLSLEIA